jgi:PTH1 family peptidyl-tRNA hydrolase
VHLVVGLGNPGERYARTRHNVAWAVLDELAARHRAQPAPGHTTFRARAAVIDGRAVELLEPLTFMNLSGEALLAWRDRRGREDDLLVVSDDVYLPLGTLRVRTSGSTGGHRGLESIEAAVGSRDYARLRIGVGAADSSAALREHVLEEVAPEEAPALAEAVRRAADAVGTWVAEGTLAAMNQFNRRTAPAAGQASQEESET